MKRLRSSVRLMALMGLLPLGFTSCTVAPSAAERSARQDVAAIGAQLRPRHAKPALPELTAASPLADVLRYAALNHPQVEAAYDEWRAAVAAIAPARALPDPQLTFEADVVDTLMTFMPGVMFDVMAARKREVMARELTATSTVAARAYVSAVMRVATDARKAWIELAYVEEALRLRQDSVAALERSLAIADAEYTTGRGMGSLAAQVRVANDIAKVRSDLGGLTDRRVAARARFKSALGLSRSEPNPAWPAPTLTATPLPPDEEIWQKITSANAELGRMRAMVDMAAAGIDVAKLAGTPDFTIGAMADLKADPLMVRPTARVTLPIWREKIAANIAAAQARHDASVARVTAEEVNLAAELAQMLYMVRDADRMIAFVDTTALPNFARTIDTVAAGYQAGMAGPAMIPETQLMALSMRLDRTNALRERELAVTDLMLLTAQIAPTGSPLLAAR